MGWILVSLVSIALIASVFIAVHHAEVVAHRVGEPFGTLILAMAVTVIEVALIVSMMLSAKGASSELARDTVFATVMIVSNGVIGIDRKSTRLNSSHLVISYAVFCLKKKKQIITLV